MLQSTTLSIKRGKTLATFLEQAGNSASQWLKEQLCSGGGFLLDNLPAIGPAGRAARETARGIHGAVCGLPTPPELGEPTLPPPPFGGGQCPGVEYLITYDYEGWTQFSQPATVIPPQSPRIAIGPLRGFQMEQPKVVNNIEGFGRIVFLSGGPNATWHQASANSALRNPVIRAVERVDGLPDECGDPPGGPPIPPPPAPPVPTPPDIDLPVTPDGGGPDVDFTFSPRVGPVFIGVGGALIVPVNVRINGPNINVNAPISIPVNISLPDFNISFPGQGGGGGAPDDPAAPVPPGPPPRPVPGPPREVCCDPPSVPGPEVEVEDDEPVEPTAQGLRFIGIRVSCVVNPAQGSFTVVGQGGGQNNLYLPRLANIYFDVRVNNQSGVGQPATVGPIPVQLLRQYIPAPEGISSVRWRVVREPGVQATVIPLFVPANRT